MLWNNRLQLKPRTQEELASIRAAMEAREAEAKDQHGPSFTTEEEMFEYLLAAMDGPRPASVDFSSVGQMERFRKYVAGKRGKA